MLLTDDAQEMVRVAQRISPRLTPAGMLWLGWPKKASGVARGHRYADMLRPGGTKHGTRLVDNKTCAVDDVWSGLRFVVRVKDRPRR